MSKVPFGVVTRKNISENVIHLRKMHGLTQYNFADLMHIPRSRIARVEAFTRKVDLQWSRLIRFARCLASKKLYL